jgi:DHHC palmitoyltransferase
MTTSNTTPNSIASSNHITTETRSTEADRRSTRRMKQRRSFSICPSLLQCRSLRWSIPKRQRFIEFFFDSFSTFLEWFVYGIGPLLILLALSIMMELSYTFFYILLPMIHHKYLQSPFRSIILFIHCGIVTFILINVLFNYICCVLQKHTGKNYDQVIQEYAALADVALPSTPQELATYRRDLIERLSQRMKQLESDTAETSSPRPKPRAWMLLGPYEWGYCSNSQQVKPPRAHYDHVTKSLVLNLDHYCPWMFNASTYFLWDVL